MFSGEASLVRLLVYVLRARLDEVRSNDRGASAIEWAVITAIIVVAAAAVAAVIVGVVNRRAADISRY